MTGQTLEFGAEVGKLLDIVVHSLYSDKQVFLRELISNASDACDRLRYASLVQPELTAGDADLKIRLIPNKEARTLTIVDNGVGMNRDDLISNLGTIARSGTAAFLSQLSGDAKKDMALIGQFGVGFYSAFIVAEKIEVLTRKAGEEMGWRWISDGKGTYSVEEAPEAKRGASITLSLKEGEDEFLEEERLRNIVKTYSDHIALPVVMDDAEGKEATLNAASALWTRSKSEISQEQYDEFYRHAAHGFDKPWMTIHYKAEGAIEYTGLLYVPSTQPFDLFTPERRCHVKLYVKRVFITDDCPEMLPGYLRFLKGVVDSADLPLNVSREMLQKNPVLAKIKAGLVKRVLGDLRKKAEENPEEYLGFWSNFGAVLKEGIYEDFERREDLLELARFRTLQSDTPISFATYVEKMSEGQEAIYTLSGDNVEAMRKSPLLEGFKARGIDVLLLTDPVDEFWTSSVGKYKEKALKPVSASGADLEKITPREESDNKKEDAPAESDISLIVAAFKQALGEEVKDVRESKLLTDSPVCLVADQGEMSIHLERLLRQHRQFNGNLPRVLEINPRHPLIRRLTEWAKVKGDDPKVVDAAHLLLDQARLLEGEPIPDPASFAKRLSEALLR